MTLSELRNLLNDQLILATYEHALLGDLIEKLDAKTDWTRLYRFMDRQDQLDEEISIAVQWLRWLR